MNFIFYDLETTGRTNSWDQIIQIGAILTNSSLEEIDRFELRCKLSPGAIPYPTALLVNNTTVDVLERTNLTHYSFSKIISKKFREWGPSIFIGYNSISFDEEFLRNSFFKNLLDPYLTVTNSNKRADLLNIVRATSIYYPDTLNTNINAKGNRVFKLDQISPLNLKTKFNAHDAMGDTLATLGIAQIVKTKANSLWKRSLDSCGRKETSEIIEKNNIFCTFETIFGKIKPFVLSLVGYHPKYRWALCFDLKNDPKDLIALSDKELKNAISSSPKILRSVKTNKNPVILDFSFFDNIPEYFDLDKDVFIERASLINSNIELKERIIKLIEQDFLLDEENISQLDIYAEETIYHSFPSSSDKALMAEFHKAEPEYKLSIASKFKEEKYFYFAKKLLYEESPHVLNQGFYNEIHKSIAEKIFSTNDEKWNTLAKGYKEIDDLRAKQEYQDNDAVLQNLSEINNFIESIEKTYENA